MRMANHSPQTARHSRAHSRRADVDHYRNFESVDRLPKRVEFAIVDGEMAHDRMEVKSEKLEHFNGFFGVLDGLRSLPRIDGRPRLANHARITIAHFGDVLVGARRRAGNRFDV